MSLAQAHMSCESVTPPAIEAGIRGFEGSAVVAKGDKLPTKPAGGGLKELEKRLLEGTKTTSFTTYVRENFAQFSRLVGAASRRPDKWVVIAEWAVDEGLTGGNPLKWQTAKRAYERVRAEKNPKKGKGQPPKVEGEAVPAPVTMLPAEGRSTPIPGPSGAMDTLAASLGGPSISAPARHQFGLAKLKRNKDE